MIETFKAIAMAVIDAITSRTCAATVSEVLSNTDSHMRYQHSAYIYDLQYSPLDGGVLIFRIEDRKTGMYREGSVEVAIASSSTIAEQLEAFRGQIELDTFTRMVNMPIEK